MEKFFGTSWKTSLMGYLSAIGVALYPLLQDGSIDLKKDWQNLVIAAALAVWGRIQKDTNGVTAKEAQVVKEAASIITTENK